MQEHPTFRATMSPDPFMPLADRIRDLDFGFLWINLDGLVPPAVPLALASMMVQEVQKVLRATQIEATLLPWVSKLRVGLSEHV
jgi:hypothetical protein